ncbi:hypothetical protein BDK51DRAFT_30830 [Blyttiomyces helicus]|uniref:Uncharacterized protein n=1 Tax=Blyttiomyces helicus TaxID=388810 RepID=A0A4P9WJE0_9FUNG|nr:hypothetical protein BDK51DRAFT_30830 [Blyttiomyces helicus]|eukprot:RKO91608.1 hypothetical protein BDK51DRAFT_30830 [Blyttiomyces helicus]
MPRAGGLGKVNLDPRITPASRGRWAMGRQSARSAPGIGVVALICRVMTYVAVTLMVVNVTTQIATQAMPDRRYLCRWEPDGAQDDVTAKRVAGKKTMLEIGETAYGGGRSGGHCGDCGGGKRYTVDCLQREEADGEWPHKHHLMNRRHLPPAFDVVSKKCGVPQACHTIPQQIRDHLSEKARTQCDPYPPNQTRKGGHAYISLSVVPPQASTQGQPVVVRKHGDGQNRRQTYDGENNSNALSERRPSPVPRPLRCDGLEVTDPWLPASCAGAYSVSFLAEEASNNLREGGSDGESQERTPDNITTAWERQQGPSAHGHPRYRPKTGISKDRRTQHASRTGGCSTSSLILVAALIAGSWSKPATHTIRDRVYPFAAAKELFQ